jgi:hypothetical protein
MKPQSKRGGARPNSGPKPDIEKNIILYNIALSLGIGLDRSRRLMSEYNNRPELLIGEKNCRKLRKVAASKDVQAALAICQQIYVERRAASGFRS